VLAILKDRNVALATTVAALGYFVDIFDLLLFALVRVKSLKDILGSKIVAAQHDLASRARFESPEALQQAQDQLADRMLRDAGVMLDNILQMTGLVLGGIVWGVLADRLGRLQMLFGSILVYSVANILNAFVADVPADGGLAFLHQVGLGTAYNQYAVLRFLAGFGLAGELGAGITLVSELVSKEHRGFATTLVATVGILGAVFAYFVTEWVTEWRNAFLIGGLLGLALLFLRVGVVESGMFDRVKQSHAPGRGALWMLVWPAARARRYLALILCAVPIWYCVGVLVKYSDVIGSSLGMAPVDKPKPGLAIMWCYVGLALGDLASGLLSQVLRSRRKALLAFHVRTAAAIGAYFMVGPRTRGSSTRAAVRWASHRATGPSSSPPPRSSSAPTCGPRPPPAPRTSCAGRRPAARCSGTGSRASSAAPWRPTSRATRARRGAGRPWWARSWCRWRSSPRWHSEKPSGPASTGPSAPTGPARTARTAMPARGHNGHPWKPRAP